MQVASSAPFNAALEARLNALVYEAFGLDAEDVAVIEGSVGGKE